MFQSLLTVARYLILLLHCENWTYALKNLKKSFVYLKNIGTLEQVNKINDLSIPKLEQKVEQVKNRVKEVKFRFTNLFF